jgi:peptide/nickel transport system permease protein
MSAYLLRRMLYAIPILIGVNLITFALFFVVNTPDDMARMALGAKRVTPDVIEKWKSDRGYDKPLFVNDEKPGLGQFTETIFFQKSVRLFAFDFGNADDGRSIGHEIRSRMWASLALQVPVFLLGLLTYISVALVLAFFRGTAFDLWGVVACVGLMSISALFYIIGGQYLISKVLALAPISGYSGGWDALKFVFLPVLIGVFEGVGGSARWYRTLFIEEIGKDYVRTARAKGLAERTVLFKHVLKNGLIPILTGTIAVIPKLFLGALLMESFFGIPGLGSYTIDALQAQDFGIVRSMVFLGALLYIVGLVMTDVAYTVADPRVRFDA